MSQKEFLTRREASNHLKERGLDCAVATLAKLACIGGGPPILYFGSSLRPKPLYSPSDLDAWAAGRMRRAASTSDRPQQCHPATVGRPGEAAETREQGGS